jgi:hypothetical protein
MSRKSRKAQRRRKWRRRFKSVGSPSNAMHQALGEFLTEMGRVEFRMLLLMDITNEAPLEALFDEYSGRTFADKINIFKKWCDFGRVPDEQNRRCKGFTRNWMNSDRYETSWFMVRLGKEPLKASLVNPTGWGS